jgi:hypothetical protein
MDARKNGGKGKIKKEQITQELEFNCTPFDSNFEELRKELKNSTENTINRLDDIIQSSSKLSNKKMYLELFRALVVDSARSSESLIYLFEYLADLRASVLILFTELEKVNGNTNKDMRKIRSKFDELLNNPAMIEIGKVLQNIQRIGEERKKVQEKNPAKEYLR